MLLKTLIFDSSSSAWINDRRVNIVFLRIQETHLNEILKHRGYIYLNEIYEALCIGWNPGDENVCIRNDSADRRIDFVVDDEPNNSFSVHILTP